MKPAKDSLPGTRVVILNEFIGQTERFEPVRPKGFHKETPLVLEHIRDENNDFSEMDGLDPNAHLGKRASVAWSCKMTEAKDTTPE